MSDDTAAEVVPGSSRHRRVRRRATSSSASPRSCTAGWPRRSGPFVICRKSGYEVEDVDGNVYLDCISAMASVPVGAARADITEAAVEALRRYGNEDTHYYSHEYVLPLAERLWRSRPATSRASTSR